MPLNLFNNKQLDTTSHISAPGRRGAQACAHLVHLGPARCRSAVNLQETMSRDPAPSISLIVASAGTAEQLESFLAAMPRAVKHSCDSLVVARAAAPGEIERFSKLFPSFRFLELPHDTSLQQLRSMGVAESQEDICLITDDASQITGDRLPTALRKDTRVKRASGNQSRSYRQRSHAHSHNA